jgi:peptidoglycan/xylan/chitin deacetylase (PgdA/CDA1 family)
MRLPVVFTALFFATMIALSIGALPCFTVNAEVPHGVISVAFDDNYEDQYQYAFQIMQERGIVGTFYVLTSHIYDFSGDDSYMNFTELQNLQANGNEIGSHSVTHRTFTELSESEIRQECNNSKQTLENNGLIVTNFAYPNGPTNDNVDSIVADYYRSARTAYIEPYLMDVPTSQFRLAGFSEEPGNLTVLKNIVDQVYATNSWAIFFFHHIQPDADEVPYTTSTQDFEAFLDYAISKGVQTLTVNQVLDLTPLSIESNFGTVTPTSGFYSLGDTLSIESTPPIAGVGERYVWLGWTGFGLGSYTGTDNPATISLNGPVNQTALWTHEYKLSMFANGGTTSPSVGEYWFNAGDSVEIQALPPLSNGDDERYFWSGWSGSGTGSYSGNNNSAIITMDGPVNQTALWTHEYKLTLSSNSGSTMPLSGEYWFEAGTPVNIETFAPSAGAGERYLFDGWTGTGSGSYSGSVTSASIVMIGGVTESASWAHQYQVSVGLSGVDPDFPGTVFVVDGVSYGKGTSLWLDSGSFHSFEFKSELDVKDGEKCLWTSSSGIDSRRSGSFSVSSSGVLNGGYKVQYYVDAFSTYGVVKGSGWYDSGTTAYVRLDEGVWNETSDVRYVFTGWSESASGTALTSDGIVVNAPMSAVALWKRQFLIGFDQNGLPQGYVADVLVDSINYSLPFSLWVDEGAKVRFAYSTELSGSFGERYVLVYPVDQSELTADSSVFVTARYDLQYNVELFVLIGVPVSVLIVILGVWFFRKRRTT